MNAAALFGRQMHQYHKDALKLAGMITALLLVASIVGNVPSDSVHQSITNRESFFNNLRKMEQVRNYDLPTWGTQVWCDPNAPYDPPDYEAVCDPSETVNLIPLQGSTPSALRAIVLGSMLSIQQNRCFVLDDPLQLAKEFFYPIGLPRNHPIVTQAITEDRIHTVTPAEYWSNRKIFNSTASLLNHRDVNGHLLTKIMLRRILKLNPMVRADVCDNLDQYHFGDEFMTMSIKQHRSAYDKELRGEIPDHLVDQKFGLDTYIHYAKDAFKFFYNNRTLPIYVATDNCSVVEELRHLEPDWVFSSECDYYPTRIFSPLNLWNNAELTDGERRAYLHKIFVDLFAMATSTYFIGLGAADFSWLAFFLRGSRSHFILVDKDPSLGTFENTFDYW